MNLLHFSLGNYHICGLSTNIGFLKTLVEHPKFRNYEFNTNFINDNQKDLLTKPLPTKKDLCIASICLLLKENIESLNPWHNSDFRINSNATRKFIIENTEIEVVRVKNSLKAKIKDYEITVKAKDLGNNVFEVFTDVKKEIVRLVYHEEDLWFINDQGIVHVFITKDLHVIQDSKDALVDLKISAPMPGKIIKILVKKGDQVKENDVVAIIESMKMENRITSPKTGKISNCFFNEGDFVNGKDIIIELE